MILITSVIKDCKSWKQIKINNWHKHAIIAYILAILLYRLIGDSIIDIYAVSTVLLKILLPTALGSAICWVVEKLQQLFIVKKALTNKELLASNGDWLIGTIFWFLGTITSYICLE
jgi:hypothetical protein